MTKKEYYKWVKKYLKDLRKYCKKECGVIKKHSGSICAICIEKHQKEIDDMKAKVKL